jgi:hypothetical protein
VECCPKTPQCISIDPEPQVLHENKQEEMQMTRGILVWGLFMAIETLHGILRGIFLVPRVGLDLSNKIGWPIAACIVLGVSVLTIRWIGLKSLRSLFALGAVWAALTFIFEIGIGLLRGLDAAQLAHEINPFSGGLLVYSLLVVFLAPVIAAKLRG